MLRAKTSRKIEYSGQAGRFGCGFGWGLTKKICRFFGFGLFRVWVVFKTQNFQGDSGRVSFARSSDAWQHRAGHVQWDNAFPYPMNYMCIGSSKDNRNTSQWMQFLDQAIYLRTQHILSRPVRKQDIGDRHGNIEQTLIENGMQSSDKSSCEWTRTTTKSYHWQNVYLDLSQNGSSPIRLIRDYFIFGTSHA